MKEKGAKPGGGNCLEGRKPNCDSEMHDGYGEPWKEVNNRKGDWETTISVRKGGYDLGREECPFIESGESVYDPGLSLRLEKGGRGSAKYLLQ